MADYGTSKNEINILVVDDDDVSSEAVLRVLGKTTLNFTITTAADGLEGLQILRGEHPAKDIRPPLLVLLDLNMPRMDGLDFLDHLRADPELHKTVVFVFTTSNLDLDREASYAKHIAGYIVKSDVGPQYTKLAELFTSYGKSITLPQY
jgi:CheY-like chemotaxis protein